MYYNRSLKGIMKLINKPYKKLDVNFPLSEELENAIKAFMTHILLSNCNRLK